MRGILSFLLGFTLTLAVLGTLALLSGCGGGSGGGGSSNTEPPPPAVGQWIAYGGNENQVNGNAINFACCDNSTVSGYYLTSLPNAPKVGQTVTLTYTLTGNNPVFQQADSHDVNPPTNSLIIWQRGDNISCQGDFNFYRMFAAKAPMTLGTHTISAVLSGTNWQGCYPAYTVTDARLQTALNNLDGIGFTFGGQYFDGHGIYLSSGTATFTINSFTVQ